MMTEPKFDHHPTRTAMKFDAVAESTIDYNAAVDYKHEHRDAEHEHVIGLVTEDDRARARARAQ